MAIDSIHDCFRENTTITTIIYGGNVSKWYAERNRICKELGLGRVYCNSVPHTLPQDQIESFLKDLVQGESWKAMKLVVLGHGGIGKSTLVHRLKDYINYPVWLYNFGLLFFFLLIHY